VLVPEGYNLIANRRPFAKPARRDMPVGDSYLLFDFMRLQ